MKKVKWTLIDDKWFIREIQPQEKDQEKSYHKSVHYAFDRSGKVRRIGQKKQA